MNHQGGETPILKMETLRTEPAVESGPMQLGMDLGGRPLTPLMIGAL